MRLLLVAPYTIEESGVIVFCRRLARELHRMGMDATVVAKGGPPKGVETADFITFPSSSELRDWLLQKATDFDAVLWMGFYLQSEEFIQQILASIELREDRGVRNYFLWERTGKQEVIPQRGSIGPLLRRAATGILVLNDDQAKVINDLKLDLPVRLIAPGVDTRSQFTPLRSHAERTRIRESLGWPTAKPVILSVGRFVQRKRTTCLLSTWLGDAFLVGNSVLVLVGSGFGQEDSVEREVYRLAEEADNILIVPHRDEVDRAPFYRASDIFVLFGILEGEPSVLSEAMACGLAVVATDIAGHAGLVEHGRTGLLFGQDNALECARYLCRLVKDRAYRTKLGAAARDKAVERRDITVIAKEVLDFVS